MLNHKNNEICDLDPFRYREITDKHDDKFPQLRAILGKAPQKRLTAPCGLLWSQEEKVERVRIVMISRLIKFHFGTKNSNHVS